MILSKFREKRIKKRIEKHLIKVDKTAIYSSGTKINSILVFSDKEDAVDKTIAKELVVDISKITTLVFNEKLSEDKQLENVITPNDFGLFGTLKTQEIQKIVATEFDLLINFTTENLFFDMLTVTSKANFKVGFSNADIRFYDFMIDSDDASIFSKELKKYLKILNKL